MVSPLGYYTAEMSGKQPEDNGEKARKKASPMGRDQIYIKMK
jgi:hypothetical protein